MMWEMGKLTLLSIVAVVLVAAVMGRPLNAETMGVLAIGVGSTLVALFGCTCIFYEALRDDDQGGGK